MDYPRLKQLILTIPDYNTKTYQEIADYLNTEITVQGPIAPAHGATWAAANGAFSLLEGVQVGNPLYDAAKAFLLFLNGTLGNLDPTNEAVAQMAGAFVAANVITQQQIDGLLALGQIQTTRAAQAGLQAIYYGDVLEAMEGGY